MLNIGDLQGLWRRSLIVWPDGRRDGTTVVSWLQGPNFYIDLRAPASRPDFAGVATRDDLTFDQVTWLATQEGFAGQLFFDGHFFAWQRLIDYQPKSPNADAGRLWFEDGRMIEEGRDIPYIEHWHRDDHAEVTPCGALRLVDRDTGGTGLLVRTGSLFMYARDRPLVLPPGHSLSGCVAAATLADARIMIDCEISFGRISAAGWIIETSSLPYREGAALRPAIADGHTQFRNADVTASGVPHARAWTVSQSEGDLMFTDACVAVV